MHPDVHRPRRVGRLLAAAGTTAVLVGALSAFPASAGTTAAAYGHHTCDTNAGTRPGCAYWNEYRSGGYLTKIDGYVVDRSSDGACVYANIYWYYRGHVIDEDYTGRACPKGDTDHFTKKPGDGPLERSDGVAVELRTA